MPKHKFIEFPDVDTELQVVKLKLWEKLVPVALFAHREPYIPWQVIGDMLNIDHERELSRLMRTSSYLSQQIDFFAWKDPEVVELLGDTIAAWITFSGISLWLAGLDVSCLDDAQAAQTLQFIVMLLHGHPANLFGSKIASSLNIVASSVS